MSFINVSRKIGVGTIVEPEGHFIKVSGMMLCRDFMPQTNDAAHQQRERGFNGVRMQVVNGVDAILALFFWRKGGKPPHE
jgi:hypothetical protein